MDWLTIAGEALGIGAVVYTAATAAIRVELRYLRRDVDRAQDIADEAHRRLNEHLVQHSDA